MIPPLPIEAPVPPSTAIVARTSRGYWREAGGRLRRNRIGIVSGGVLLFFVVVALAAPLLAALITHTDYRSIDLINTFARRLTPSHILGTDELGRDELTRLLFGAQVSMGIGFLAVVVALTIGACVGLVAGFYGGLIDGLLMRFVDMILATPAIFLFILMSILFKPNPITLSRIIASLVSGRIPPLPTADAPSLPTPHSLPPTTPSRPSQ